MEFFYVHTLTTLANNIAYYAGQIIAYTRITIIDLRSTN